MLPKLHGLFKPNKTVMKIGEEFKKNDAIKMKIITGEIMLKEYEMIINANKKFKCIQSLKFMDQ